MAPPVGVNDSHALVWPEITPTGPYGKVICVPSSAHPHTVPNAIASGTCGAHTVVDALFAWLLLIVTRNTNMWVHHPADGEPTSTPIVAHDDGSNTAVMVQTPAHPKKQRKVRSRAGTFVPTTTRTTRSGCLKKPPPSKDGGIFPKGIQPLRRGTQRMTPPHDAILKAQVSKLGWMATFVPTKRSFGAWERSLSQGLGLRSWVGVPTSSNVWTSVIPPCHQNPMVVAFVLFGEQ